MKTGQLLAAALAMGASVATSMGDTLRSGYGRICNKPNFKFEKYRKGRHQTERSPGWNWDGCTQSEKKDDLPRGYPGAKLARKAMMKQIAVKHPRGLRLDGVTI